MNREVKFRAKSIESTDWCYGIMHNDGVNLFPVRVDMNTIGQFTGLTDKNGKEIYVGDIVRFYRIETCGNGWDEPRESWVKEIVGEVVYDFGMFYVETEEVPFTAPISWDGINSLKYAIEEFGLESAEEDEMVDYKGTKIDEHIVGVEVIGNVFDNTELLEE